MTEDGIKLVSTAGEVIWSLSLDAALGGLQFSVDSERLYFQKQAKNPTEIWSVVPKPGAKPVLEATVQNGGLPFRVAAGRILATPAQFDRLMAALADAKEPGYDRVWPRPYGSRILCCLA